MPSEFDIISRYFTRDTHREDILLGIGDDAAVIAPPPGKSLVVTLDSLVEQVHFHAADEPAAIGHKLLAVNLSDLAAMGAEPAWATLALTLPAVDTDWLEQFAAGLFALADEYAVALVGGDTTRGPLTLSLQLAGYVDDARFLARRGALAGDDIYVSGTLGDAGLALRARAGELRLDPAAGEFAEQRLCRPQPRLALGRGLVGLASCAIDISDGLLADLGHILEHSAVAAEIELAALPLSAAVNAHLHDDWALPLASGDDYELCFTAPVAARGAIDSLAAGVETAVSRIGRIRAGQGLVCRLPNGEAYLPARAGYEHFEMGED